MLAPEVLFEKRAASAPQDSEQLVSVVVTLFNYKRFLDDCLSSAAAQTHRRLELVVVDDCSTDGSEQTAREWLEENYARFERAALLQHRKNQGLSAARNTAFRAAEAPYVFVLDADNMIYPRAIARLLETLEEYGAGVAYSQLEFFDEECRLGLAETWTRELFKRENYVDAMALISKAAWERVGGYGDLKYGWEDYELWCKFIENDIPGIFVPEILCRYRVHGTSMLQTRTNHNRPVLVKEMLKLHPWLEVSAG